MISTLESTLLQDDRVEGRIRQTLFDLLQHEASLLKVRLCSRIMRDLVDQRKSRMFSSLYFHMPMGRLDTKYSIPALQRIAPFCTSMIVKVTYSELNSPYTMGEAVAEDEERSQALEQRRQEFENRRPPPGISRGIWNARNTFQEDSPSQSIAARIRRYAPQSIEAQNLDVVLVQQIFQHMHQLATLVIRPNADPGWPGLTQTEEILVTIRLALERSRLRSLRCVRLDPLHAAGVLHVRWAAFGAFREQPLIPINDSALSLRQRSGAEIWKNLATLDLRIRNPAATGRLNAKQMMMFFQVLDDYLRSFRRTLRCLKFIWLDAPGPTPLAVVDTLERPPYIWHKLQEFCYGNMVAPEMVSELVAQRMPNLKKLKALVVLAGESDPAEDEWRLVDIASRDPDRTTLDLPTSNSTSKLSQLSLVPPPLSLRKAPAVADFAARMRASSSVYSQSIHSNDEQDPNGNPEAFETDSDTTMKAPEPPPAEEQHSVLEVPPITSPSSSAGSASSAGGIMDQPAMIRTVARGMPAYHSTPEFRAPIASSVYSRDENGNYIPVRQRWNRVVKKPQVRNVPAAARGHSPLPHESGPSSETIPDMKVTAPAQVPVAPNNQRVGREPPVVPPSNLIARKNHIDLGDTAGYKSARDEYMKKISQEGGTSAVTPDADRNHLVSEGVGTWTRDRIRNWTNTVRSGRPPSTVTTRSINTIKTTGSRPLSKFLANLRETGRPSRR